VDDVLGLQPFEAVSPLNPNLVPVHYGFYISAILLLNCVIDDEQEAYQKVLEASLAMAHLARRVRSPGSVAAIHGPPTLMVSTSYLPVLRSFSEHVLVTSATYLRRM
jgi:hypothetical protein